MNKHSLAFLVMAALVMAAGSAAAVGPGKELSWPGGGAGTVRFEGKDHAEEGHGCKDCHPGLFTMKYGAAKMTMAALNSGKYCGACHNGKAAFSTTDPKECHECHKDRSKHGEDDDHKGRKKKHDDD
jgi:c(7)-type cytochrome triheme protein